MPLVMTINDSLRAAGVAGRGMRNEPERQESHSGSAISSGGLMCRKQYSSETSYAIFSTPQMTSGSAANDVDNSAPDSAGLTADARLRGTAVTLAAAVRSAGVTTAMT